MAKQIFTNEKIDCDKKILVILNRLRSFSKCGHGQHGPVETLKIMTIYATFVKTFLWTYLARYCVSKLGFP